MCTITLKPFSLNSSGTYTTLFSVIFSLFLTIICLIFAVIEINKYGSHDEIKTYKIETSDFYSSDILQEVPNTDTDLFDLSIEYNCGAVLCEEVKPHQIIVDGTEIEMQKDEEV